MTMQDNSEARRTGFGRPVAGGWLDAEDLRVIRLTVAITIGLILTLLVLFDLALGFILATDMRTTRAVAAYGLAADLFPWSVALTAIASLPVMVGWTLSKLPLPKLPRPGFA